MNMLKTEEAIKNRKFRDTWQHTTNKTTNTTQYVLDTANTQANTNKVNKT